MSKDIQRPRVKALPGTRIQWRDDIGAFYVHCESTAEFLSADKYPRGEGAFNESESGSYDFTGTKTYSAAERLLTEGWKEGAEKAKAIASRIAPHIAEATVAERHDTDWDVAGDEPDVGRFLEGVPENMVQFVVKNVPAAGRVASIIIHGSISAGIQNDAVLAVD